MSPFESAFPERPSKAQRRMEARYCAALVVLQRHGFTWAVGPVAGPPALRVGHGKTGPLGQLALVHDGGVRDESGRHLSAPGLLRWVSARAEEAAGRIARQNEITTARNAQLRRQVVRELPWWRAAAGLGFVAWALTGWALRAHPELLPQCPEWSGPALVAAASWMEGVLLWRCWSIPRWLARTAAQCPGPT